MPIKTKLFGWLRIFSTSTTMEGTQEVIEDTVVEEPSLSFSNYEEMDKLFVSELKSLVRKYQSVILDNCGKFKMKGYDINVGKIATTKRKGEMVALGIVAESAASSIARAVVLSFKSSPAGEEMSKEQFRKELLLGWNELLRDEIDS